MPEEFDPCWEYYEADPEIEELMYKDKDTITKGHFPRPTGDVVVPGFTERKRKVKIVRGEREPQYPYKQKDWLFKDLWMQGLTYRQIMDIMKVECFVTIHMWRKRLGLPMRKCGNYLRKDQIAHMKAQVQE